MNVSTPPSGCLEAAASTVTKSSARRIATSDGNAQRLGPTVWADLKGTSIPGRRHRREPRRPISTTPPSAADLFALRGDLLRAVLAALAGAAGSSAARTSKGSPPSRRPAPRSAASTTTPTGDAGDMMSIPVNGAAARRSARPASTSPPRVPRGSHLRRRKVVRRQIKKKGDALRPACLAREGFPPYGTVNSANEPDGYDAESPGTSSPGDWGELTRGSGHGDAGGRAASSGSRGSTNKVRTSRCSPPRLAMHARAIANAARWLGQALRWSATIVRARGARRAASTARPTSRRRRRDVDTARARRSIALTAVRPFPHRIRRCDD